MFKRIVGVLPVRDGIVVKSYGYRMWRPAGGLRTALLNLDRWGADEILVLDISGRVGIDPKVAGGLRAASVSTPVTYGGGIRSVEDATRALRAGADRILIESLLWRGQSEILRIADEIGQQAIVASLPTSGSSSGTFRVSCSRAEVHRCPPESLEEGLELVASSPVEEVLVTDVDAEGTHGRFTLELAARIGPVMFASRKPVIWFGGIGASSADELLRMRESVGVAFANSFLERELALKEIREALYSGAEYLVRRVDVRHD